MVNHVSGCPVCGSGLSIDTLATYGRCKRCVKDGREVEVEYHPPGRKRDAILAEYAQWMERNPQTPWERAVGGLCMFVVDDGRAHWP